MADEDRDGERTIAGGWWEDHCWWLVEQDHCWWLMEPQEPKLAQ